MTSTYSQNLRLEMIGDGDQSGVWGDTTNYNLGTLLEQAITGVVNITLGATNYTLTNYDGLSNEARNAVLIVSGSPGAARYVLIPAGQSKTYIVNNSVAGGYSLYVQTDAGGSTGSGAYAEIPNGSTLLVYSTGSDCYAVQPTTATTPSVTAFTGYTLAGKLYTSTSLSVGQTIYNPGLTSGTTVTGGAVSPTGYNLSTTPSPEIGTSSNVQPFVAVTTPTALATVDYIQNKTQSIKLNGTPTATTATAAIYDGYITGSTLVVTKVYENSSVAVGQYINGTYVTSGSNITGLGTGLTGSTTTLTGYISGTALTIVSGDTSAIKVGAYVYGLGIDAATRIVSGSGTGWTVDTSSTSGSATSPISISCFGAGNGGTGWYTLNTSSVGVTNTPLIAYYQPEQIANMTLFSNVAYLVGTLGTQDYNNVAITGGTIQGVTITNLAADLAVADGGTGVSTIAPNALMVGAGTSGITTIPPGTNGNLLKSTVGATVNNNSFVVGTQYTIATLGTTSNSEWNTIAGTSSVTYAVGDVFTAAVTGAGVGNGTATTNVWTSETVASITTTSGSAPYYGARAYVRYGLSANNTITGTWSGTWATAGSSATVTLTVTSGTLPIAVNNRLYITFNTGTGYPASGVYTIATVISSTQFTISATSSTSGTKNGSFTVYTPGAFYGENVLSVTNAEAGATATLWFVNFTTPMNADTYTTLASGSAATILSNAATTLPTAYSVAVDGPALSATAFVNVVVFE